MNRVDKARYITLIITGIEIILGYSLYLAVLFLKDEPLNLLNSESLIYILFVVGIWGVLGALVILSAIFKHVYHALAVIMTLVSMSSLLLTMLLPSLFVFAFMFCVTGPFIAYYVILIISKIKNKSTG